MSAELIRKYATGYPETLVISSESKIITAFQGEYAAVNWMANPTEIEAFFRVTLPKD